MQGENVLGVKFWVCSGRVSDDFLTFSIKGYQNREDSGKIGEVKIRYKVDRLWDRKNIDDGSAEVWWQDF